MKKLAHTGIAIAAVILVGTLLSFLGIASAYFIAATAVSFYFAGREVAQAEYRWIEGHGNGKRANLKPFSIWNTEGLWSEKSWMWDWALPTLVAFGLALVLTRTNF